MKKMGVITIACILSFILFQRCHRVGSCDMGMPWVIIHYVDKNGNDLFVNGQNGYYRDSTYFIDASGNIICSAKSYFVDWTSSTMKVGPYKSASDRYSNIVVHLKIGIDDTLKRHLTSGACTQLDSIWYNGQLKKAGARVISGVTNPDLYTTMFDVVH